MPEPYRRFHERFFCELPVSIRVAESRARMGVGTIENLSMGGAALNSSAPLQPGALYEFRFEAESRRDRFRLTGRILWQQPHPPPARGQKPKPGRRYGVSFDLSPRQQAVLRRLIDSLRIDRSAREEDEGPKRDYWSI